MLHVMEVMIWIFYFTHMSIFSQFTGINPYPADSNYGDFAIFVSSLTWKMEM